MNNPETLATLVTRDSGRKQTKQQQKYKQQQPKTEHRELTIKMSKTDLTKKQGVNQMLEKLSQQAA